MEVFEFRSLSHPDRFIRHRNFLGELTRKEGPRDDFRFALVPRGQDRVALRSKNFPQLFLRHRDFRLRLEGPSGPTDGLFAIDATFLMVPGLADPNAVSFQSFNFRDRFIHQRDFHLFVEALEDPGLAPDATFVKERPPVLIDTGTELESVDA